MLSPCTGCRRHVRVADERCPFCGAANRGPPPMRKVPPSRLSRGALVAFTLSAAGCSSPSEAEPPAATDSSVDVGADTPKDTGTPPPIDALDDTGVPGNVYGAPPPCGSYGCSPPEVCSDDGAFSGDCWNPIGVCVSFGCDPGDGTKIVGCNGDTGLCVRRGSLSVCLPACEFADAVTAPNGCSGKNRCLPAGWGKETFTMKVIGVGYCLGGCRADTDCPPGNSCQVETALCVKTKVSYTKSLGEACTDLDGKNCNCVYSRTDKKGYCTTTCAVGDTCPTGFTCDPELPKTPIRAEDVVFTNTPVGLGGNCLKDCTSDADCAGLGAYCEEMAGTGRRTCHVGARPTE